MASPPGATFLFVEMPEPLGFDTFSNSVQDQIVNSLLFDNPDMDSLKLFEETRSRVRHLWDNLPLSEKQIFIDMELPQLPPRTRRPPERDLKPFTRETSPKRSPPKLPSRYIIYMEPTIPQVRLHCREWNGNVPVNSTFTLAVGRVIYEPEDREISFLIKPYEPQSNPLLPGCQFLCTTNPDARVIVDKSLVLEIRSSPSIPQTALPRYKEMLQVFQRDFFMRPDFGIAMSSSEYELAYEWYQRLSKILNLDEFLQHPVVETPVIQSTSVTAAIQKVARLWATNRAIPGRKEPQRIIDECNYRFAKWTF